MASKGGALADVGKEIAATLRTAGEDLHRLTKRVADLEELEVLVVEYDEAIRELDAKPVREQCLELMRIASERDERVRSWARRKARQNGKG